HGVQEECASENGERFDHEITAEPRCEANASAGRCPEITGRGRACQPPGFRFLHESACERREVAIYARHLARPNTIAGKAPAGAGETGESRGLPWVATLDGLRTLRAVSGWGNIECRFRATRCCATSCGTRR